MSEQDESSSRSHSGRFMKGRSGNPKGRPKKDRRKDVSAFDIIVDKTLTLIRHGEPREVTLEEALQHQTYKDALAGNRSARQQVLNMIAKREAYLSKKAKKDVETGFDIVYETSDPTNADEALQILDIARRDPDRKADPDDGTPLLLEPWGVQMALRRRRGGGRLTDTDIREIERSTHDAASLCWPKGTKT